MKICPNCNNKINSDHNYCMRCGHLLTNQNDNQINTLNSNIENNPQTDIYNQTPNIIEYNSEYRSNKVPKIIIIIIFIILALFLFQKFFSYIISLSQRVYKIENLTINIKEDWKEDESILQKDTCMLLGGIAKEGINTGEDILDSIEKYSKEGMEKNIITINSIEWEQVKAHSTDGIAKTEILYKKHNNKGYLVILSYSDEQSECMTDWEEMKQTIKLK